MKRIVLNTRIQEKKKREFDVIKLIMHFKRQQSITVDNKYTNWEINMHENKI